MRRIALLLEYEGTGYHGSQWQPGHDTIEGRLRAAVLALTGEQARVTSQGRTDSGVHACGQVVAINTAGTLPVRAFVGGLNHHLPPDIVVKAAREAPPTFDVRRRAESRRYRYLVRCSPQRSPLWRRFAWVWDDIVDLAAMQQASAALIGAHDFAAFAGCPDRPTSTVRRMFGAEVRQKDDLVSFTFEATAFLPHQVRRTVGALMEVGRGRMTEETFRNFLSGGAFALAGPAAPPAGLYLVRVRYDPPLFEESR